MKSLLLLRHGKSDWDAPHPTDHKRPLAERGRKGARRVGRFLARVGQPPDLVLSSSATRALDTARLASRSGRWRCRVETSDRLYEAASNEILAIVRAVEPEVSRLMVVGHEPTLSVLAGRLVGKARLRFPTAALARIDFEIDEWAAVAFGRGTLVWLVVPRLLRREPRRLKNK